MASSNLFFQLPRATVDLVISLREVVFFPLASLAQGLTRELRSPGSALQGPWVGDTGGRMDTHTPRLPHALTDLPSCCQCALVVVERWLSHNSVGERYPRVVMVFFLEGGHT